MASKVASAGTTVNMAQHQNFVTVRKYVDEAVTRDPL